MTDRNLHSVSFTSPPVLTSLSPADCPWPVVESSLKRFSFSGHPPLSLSPVSIDPQRQSITVSAAQGEEGEGRGRARPEGLMGREIRKGDLEQQEELCRGGRVKNTLAFKCKGFPQLKEKHVFCVLPAFNTWLLSARCSLTVCWRWPVNRLGTAQKCTGNHPPPPAFCHCTGFYFERVFNQPWNLPLGLWAVTGLLPGVWFVFCQIIWGCHWETAGSTEKHMKLFYNNI